MFATEKQLLTSPYRNACIGLFTKTYSEKYLKNHFPISKQIGQTSTRKHSMALFNTSPPQTIHHSHISIISTQTAVAGKSARDWKQWHGRLQSEMIYQPLSPALSSDDELLSLVMYGGGTKEAGRNGEEVLKSFGTRKFSMNNGV